MSKKSRNKTSTKSNQQYLPGESEIEKQIDKFFWLVIPVFTIIYFYVSKISIGFYQDDEVAQYINMIEFWHDPFVILGNAPKPGYKIFMVIPALISYNAVLVMNAFIASLTVYFTYRMLKVYEIPFAFFGALLLAVQPLFFDLSFRSYSEIFTALLIALLLISYKKEKYFLTSLIGGYIFTVRQEFALFLLVLAIIYFMKKRYVAIAGFAVFPLLYNILGLIKSGDALYILTEMQKVAGLQYQSQGLFHYFEVYIYIVGPVTLLMFAFGFFGFIQDTSKMKEYFNKYLLFYVIFVSIFITQVLTMLNDGPNPGNWRYLLHISPVCVFFATIGLNKLTDDSFKKSSYIIAGGLALFTLIFSSRKTDGFRLLEQSDYANLFVIIIAFMFVLMFSNVSKKVYLTKLSIALIIISVLSLWITYEPRQLSSENVAVKNLAERIDAYENIGDKKVLTNHNVLKFYSTAYKNNPTSFKSIDSESVDQLPSGSIILWESHYGYRPEWGLDVSLEMLQDTTKFTLVDQLITPDQRFGAFIFQKN